MPSKLKLGQRWRQAPTVPEIVRRHPSDSSRR
jgi:hypothetical protein